MFCCALLYVHSSIAIILMGKRELVALLNLSSRYLVMVERLFFAVPRGCLRFVIVVFPDHTHLLFSMYMCSLVSVNCSHLSSVKQLTIEIHIVLCQYSYHSLIMFIKSSKNKTKFGKINILDCNFLSSSYVNESHKSVVYVIVIPWVVRLYLDIIHEL